MWNRRGSVVQDTPERKRLHMYIFWEIWLDEVLTQKVKYKQVKTMYFYVAKYELV